MEPLLISKDVFASLTPDQQAVMTETGEAMEAFALENAKADDNQLAVTYGQAGVKVQDMNQEVLVKWRAIAEATAWKDFAARNASCADLLKLAEAVT